MKKIALIIILSLSMQVSHALSCMRVYPEDATRLYLIKITSIQQTESRWDSKEGIAEVEVLRIYKGPIDSIKTVKEVRLYSDCSDVWGPSCVDFESKELPFKVGEYWVLVEEESENNYQWMGFGECNGFQIKMDDEQKLIEFERLFPVIWINRKSK